jgi:hypothetical protein
MFPSVDISPHPESKDMMKKLVTFAMAAAVLALTAGCSAPAADPAAAPMPTSPYSGSGATDGPKPNHTLWDYQKPVMKDKAFYAEARQGTTALQDFADDKLTVMSQLTCAAVANGETGKDVLLTQAVRSATGKEDGITPEVSKDVSHLLIAGAKNYCPDLQGTLVKVLA